MSEYKNYEGLDANATIYSCIRQIALHKIANPRTQVIRNTEKITGYVVKLHTEEDDELFGTVDVQEYTAEEADGQAQKDGLPVGLHEGVYLSAIQNNENGMVVVPFLYSDVVITTDPDTLREYVVQYSHADSIQLDAHNKVVVGATETKEWEETEDSPDVDQLEKTGVRAHTTYTPVSAFTEVANSDKDEERSMTEVTANYISAMHDKATLELNADESNIKYDKAQLIADAQQLLAKYDAKEIIIKSDGVYVGSGSATEPAVLGNQLATLLADWLGTLTQMMTTTQLGPQPPMNVAKFAALQAKVNTYKAATSGILSKIVKIAN